MSATLKNTKAVPLSISSIAISGGSAASDYVLGGNCPLRPSTLGPGQNCNITVTFTPSALGVRTATLTVTDNTRTSPRTVALTGMGVAPGDLAPSSGNFGGAPVGNTSAAPSATPPNAQDVAGPFSGMAPSEDFARGRPLPLSGIAANSLAPVSVSPASLTFASGALGTTSAAQTVTLTNHLNTSLPVSPAAATRDFAVASNTCGSSVGPGGSCTVGVTFTPTVVGARTGALTLPYNASGSPSVIPLRGAGNANGLISITVTPANPSIVAGNTQQFTATGHFGGGRTQNLTTSVLWGSSAPGVATITAAGLASGVSSGSTTITATWVTVTPDGSATGVTPGTPIINRPPASPISGSTTLTVTGTAPIASLNYSALSFNGQIQNTTSASQTVTLSNTGNGTLNISGFSVMGNNPGDFPESSTCGSSLAAGNYCTFTISFRPSGTGPRSASLVITDNSNNVTGSQQSVTLTGTGLAPLTINTPGFPDATVGIPYSSYLNASGGTGVYTWSYSLGSGQSFPSCLTVSPTAGLLLGTAVNTCVGSYTFNLTVTDSASNQKTQTVSINIDPALSTVCESGNESVLKGQYAFSLIGYRSQGFSGRVGSFIADGTGNITGGEYDRNITGVSPATFTLLASTYTVGADNRGCATFNISGAGSFSTRFVLGSISGSPGTATQGRIIEFDSPSSSAFIATGQLFQQTTATTPSASNFSALSGGYVHLLTGWDTTGRGGRIACDGVKTDTPTSGGAGTIANGEQYCNDEGVAPSGPTTGITGSYTGVDNYGRFTEIIGPTDLVGYMVSTAATGAFEVTTSINSSNATIMAGQTFQQSGGPYVQSSLSGNGVYYANGVNNSTSGKILFALTYSDGVSTLSLDQYYENDGGTWVGGNPSTGSTPYTVLSNGRVTGPAGTIYLTAPNTGVYVDNDTGGFAGYVMPQTVPGGGFTPANTAGAFFGAISEIVNQNARNEDGLINLLSGSGSALSGTDISDQTSTSSQAADEAESISGATLGSNGTISNSKSGTSQVGGLVVDTTHFLISDHTGCSGSSSCYPTIEVFGPSTADTVAITINGSTSSSDNVTAGTTLGLTVAVTGTSGTNVIWTINGLSNLTTDYGSITGSYPSFTYTAPSRVPDVATFTLTATSNADITQSASVTVTILAGSVVSPLSILTTSLPSGTLNAQYNQNILTNGGTLPLTWSITSGSLPPGLVLQYAGNGLGMITGVHTTMTGTYTFTVQATDSSTPTPKTASAPLSIVMNASPVTITTTSLPNGTMDVLYDQILRATGGTQPYTWQVGGGSLPTWASLNPSTGEIKGTPSATGTSNFTVKVTDSTLPSHVTAQVALSITINPAVVACMDSGSESLLSGQYAFSLSGYTSAGYLAVVGSFTTDGTGKITAGEVDSNGVLGVQSASINTGASSYSVGSNQLGCATIATSFGTFNTRLALGSITSSVATAGRMVEWDAPSSSTYFAATGQFQQQTAADFSSGLSGSYAFENSGVDSSSERVGVVGVLSVSNGSITAGEFDVNDAGTTANGTGATGTYTSADSNGRFTLSLTWSGQSSPDHSVSYMVSNSQLLFITTDALTTNGVQAGQMQQQTVPGGGFGSSSLDGNEVLYMTGLNGGGTGGSANLVILSADGNGNLTGTSYYDGGGTWKSPQAISCTYSIDASGRMTCGNGAPVFYLTAANKAVVMSPDTDVADGQLVPQVGSPFTTASFSGTYYMGDGEVVSYGVASAEQVGVQVATLNGSGGGSATNDYTATSGQQADQSNSFPNGSLTVNSNGTFSTDFNATINAIMISTTKFVAVDNESSTYPIIQLGSR